jgi:osmoprotectant transport system ATP-binding protein
MIELKHVSKIYDGGHRAVDDVSLSVAEGETVVLIGSSGCGKTTTLKMINRLIEPSSGEIYIRKKNIQHVNPVQLRREIGYVIQQIGLFPHMTIRENIALVPTLLKWTEKRKRERTDALMELVGLAPEQYASRFPHELSGGQRQRVGVARALAANPPILLMDEPFGALDPITRRDIQEEFLKLKQQIRKTIVFVTHDIIEAVTLGDHLAIIDKGKLLQFGPPQEILDQPADKAVEEIIGHQRFQLTLCSIKVDEICERKPATTPAEIAEAFAIPADATLLTALNVIIEKGEAALSVIDATGRNQGVLTRKRLLEQVSGLLRQDKVIGSAN